MPSHTATNPERPEAAAPRSGAQADPETPKPKALWPSASK